jgi:hypothetical protein
MVLCWLLHNANCRWRRSSCKERQQLVPSGNGPNANHHHRERHIMSLMKTTIISSPGQVTGPAFSPPQPEATCLSKSLSGILAHSILSSAFECLIASSQRLTLSTAVPTASTIRPGLPFRLKDRLSGGPALQIPAHRSGPTDLDRTTMLLLHSMFLRLSSLATLWAPQKQRASSQATTQAGTPSQPPSQQSPTQHALSVRPL